MQCEAPVPATWMPPVAASVVTEPASHAMQVAAPTPEYVPARHSVWVDAPVEDT